MINPSVVDEYAIWLAHIGVGDAAQEDLNEGGDPISERGEEVSDEDWRAAMDLARDISSWIRANPEQLLELVRAGKPVSGIQEGGSPGSPAVDAAPLYEVALGALRRHHPRPAQQPAVEQAARAIVAELEKQRAERGDDHIRLVGLGRTVEVRIVHNAVWLERQALAQGVTNKAVDDAIAVTAHAMLRESGSSSGGTT